MSQNDTLIIDKSGKVVSPLEFDDVSSFSEGLSKVEKDGRLGYINTKGEPVLGWY